MGSQQSQITEKNKILNLSEKKNCSVGFLLKDFSSYKGVKSLESSEKDVALVSTKDTVISNPKEKREIKPLSDESEVTFIWTEGGSSLFLVGSFSNWNQRFKLNKLNDYTFSTTVVLPRGKHYFKFIVDKEWRYSKNYRIETDEDNNVNNVIDTTINTIDYKSQQKGNLESKKKQNTTTSDLLSLESKKKRITYKNSYNEIYPDPSDLNSDAPILPEIYDEIFDINNNSKQNYIANNSYYYYNDNKYNHSNSSFENVIVPPHVNL